MNSEKIIFSDETYLGGVPVNGRIISLSFLYNKMVLSLNTNADPVLGYTSDLNKIIGKFDITLNTHLDEIIDGKKIILSQLLEVSKLPVTDLTNDEIKLAQADIYFCTRLGFIQNDEHNGMISSIEFDSDQYLKDYILNKKNGEEIWKNAVIQRSNRNH